MRDESRVVGDSGSCDQMSAGAGRVGVEEEEEEERRMKMKVMVAIDDSEGSFYALKWALDHIFVPMSTSVGAATPESSLDESVGMVFLVHVQPTVHEYGYQVGPVGTGSFLQPLNLYSFFFSFLFFFFFFNLS